VSPSKHVIAIDGPAGSGKSTVAKLVARQLGFDYIDTGAMYRALTLKILREGVPVNDAVAIAALAAQTVIEQEPAPEGSGVSTFVDGEDVSDAIRMPDVTSAVSAVSSHPEVRRILVERQRFAVEQAEQGGVVEGRDVGTVVFPAAPVKIYMDATVEERARRRQADMKRAGVAVDLHELAELIEVRDKTDSTRDASPLTRAADAHVIDTTGMTIEATVDTVVRLAQTAGIAREGG
jgi:CMP/dCMP kinase